ncbi:hypothetical protein CV769_04350 [Enterococcus mundtii]|uniref:BppU family phage baseplate upper protein n=1 Tax=Enterococcus mundtii TaxID=53346 RepID=UPI000C259AF2|nr:BppU family phage baseplate upper protein [Enterococcus mundtii]PJK26568.1 hypothetical protein CV769_04350 [Enterococcus mundtii]
MVYKINESIIRIQAEALKPIETKAVFWSYDRGTAKLVIQLLRKDNIPQVLSEGTTVPIRLMFNSATAEGGIGKHDYLATIEDRVNGIVSITLEDNILGYVGTVRGSVYINFPDTRSLDTAGRFNFEIRRSPIDETTPKLEDYYFNGFSQTIDKIEKIMADGKQEIDQKIADSEQQINEKLEETNNGIVQANQNIETLSNEINEANDRIDLTNQQIGNLGKLKKMYSNSIDFGNYDYSGNPNLLPPVSAQNFTLGSGATVRDGEDGEIIFTLDGSNTFIRYNTSTRMPAVLPGETYTISAEIKFHSDIVGDVSNLRFTLNYLAGGATALETARPIADTSRDKWIQISRTQIPNFSTTPPTQWYLALQDVVTANRITGTISLRKLKIEKGSTVTSIQPNLLLAPYEISKVALNPNLADNRVAFPFNTSDYRVYNGKNQKLYEAGKTYTLTVKATKPGTQLLGVFINSGSIGVGGLLPVEGIPDVWRRTFTVTDEHIDAGVTDVLQIYQIPDSTKGSVRIDWLKLEEGDTATPNISKYKYFGEGLKDSSNPYDYSWDVTPEYTEKGLNDKVSLTEPQAIEGTKDFLEQPYIEGERISTEKFGISLTGGQLSGVSVSDGTVLNWGRPYAYDNERSKTNDLFTISEDTKTLTILRNCALQFVGKFTCQTNNASYYAYLGMRVNGASDWRVAGIGGDLNWRNDVGWFCVRKFNAGDRVTLVTGTNYKTDSVNAWGVDQVYIREILSS